MNFHLQIYKYTKLFIKNLLTYTKLNFVFTFYNFYIILGLLTYLTHTFLPSTIFSPFCNPLMR